MPPDRSSDGALLARLAAGDDAACAELVRRYARSATLFAAQLLGDRDDAEDVVQAAFVLVVQRAAELDPSRPLGPWLFAVVRRLALKRQARRARRRALWRRWQGADDRSIASTASAEPAVEAASDLALVRRELRALAAMQRACFELVVLRDVSVDEVATMYDISASTVRQHVFRARQALRTRLEPLVGRLPARLTDAPGER